MTTVTVTPPREAIPDLDHSPRDQSRRHQSPHGRGLPPTIRAGPTCGGSSHPDARGDGDPPPEINSGAPAATPQR